MSYFRNSGVGDPVMRCQKSTFHGRGRRELWCTIKHRDGLVLWSSGFKKLVVPGGIPFPAPRVVAQLARPSSIWQASGRSG